MSISSLAIRVLRPLGLLKTAEVLTRPVRRPIRLRQMRRFYRQFVAPGDLCFDVGANVGNWTHALLGLGAKVVAVEPQADCAETLRRRFAGHPDLRVIAKAVSSEEGTAQLTLSQDSSELATMSTPWKEHGRWRNSRWSQTINVPTTTLDQLIAEFGLPVFCKIDVEGFECRAIQGLSRPIRVISLEYDTVILEHIEQSLDLLRRLGHATFNYSPGRPVALGSRRWLSADELLRTLRSPAHASTYGDLYARFE